MLSIDDILTIDILCNQRSAYREHLIKYVEEHHLTWEQVIVWFIYGFYLTVLGTIVWFWCISYPKEHQTLMLFLWSPHWTGKAGYPPSKTGDKHIIANTVITSQIILVVEDLWQLLYTSDYMRFKIIVNLNQSWLNIIQRDMLDRRDSLITHQVLVY